MDTGEIFQGLASLPRWVSYKMVWNLKRKKFDKIPARDERYNLSTSTPGDWSDLMTAVQTAKDVYGLSGVGFVMTGGIELNGLTLIGFDFDDVTEKWKPPFKTYAEKSPSKKGARSFGWVPAAWAKQYQDTLDTTPPNCAHAEVYIGTAPRFLTVTFDNINAEEIAPLTKKDLKTIESWGMHTYVKPTPVLPMGPDVAGEVLDLSKFKLTKNQKHLVKGTGDIDRSDTMMGFLINLLDNGGKQEDIYATIIKTPTLWQYCMSHRNTEEKALKFAKDEINRAYKDSMTGKREGLARFNKKWKPATAVVKPRTEFPAPFPGFMADMVSDAIKTQVKPQPELTQLAVAIGMAAALGAHWRLPGGGRLNLYGCGIADTGDGKENPQQAGIMVAEEAQALVIGKPGSLAGLEDSLVPWGGMLCEVNEVAHFFAAMNDSRAPSYMIEIAGSFLRLFSASQNKYRKRVLKDKKEREDIDHPALSFLGFATPKKLGTAVNTTNVTDGMLGRFLFVPGLEDPDECCAWEHELGELALRVSVKARIKAINGAMSYSLLTGYGIPITATPEAIQAFKALMLEFRQLRRSTESAHAKNLLKRSNEKANRLAGVIAVWDNPTKPEITVEHVAYAAQFVRASDAAVINFMDEHVHDGDEQADAATLLKMMQRFLSEDLTTQNTKFRALIKRGLVPRSLLMSRAKLKDKRRFDAAIDNLVATGVIEQDDEESEHPNSRKETTKVLWLKVED
ncbi:DUF3987 domain-containing protein [Pseudomonas sp. NPDC086251]|uniref:DUF3987 domain-containing protein n=1 Tax=Pseudomonas sp. NPDC086251 TaxID=3364431 RepID=UPI003839B07A